MPSKFVLTGGLVAAAFIGGFALAKILKRLGG